MYLPEPNLNGLEFYKKDRTAPCYFSCVFVLLLFSLSLSMTVCNLATKNIAIESPNEINCKKNMLK